MARVRPSPTGVVLALATRLKAEGRDVISLATGEPDFDTPAPIKDAAIAAIRAGETKYTPIDGTAELKAAVARKFARANGLDYAPEQIIVSVGAKQALFNLCLALLGPGGAGRHSKYIMSISRPTAVILHSVTGRSEATSRSAAGHKAGTSALRTFPESG